jgi:asparagine synthase (glutamine-hydrolysing)
MLKRLGCEHVLCYTYGREGSYEVEMARSVSAQLGYDWELITYSKEKWQQFYTDPVFNKYCSFAGNFSSNPHFQDFIAVQQLVEQGKIDEQTLLVPGHSADLLAGKWLPVEVNEGNGEVLVKQGLVDLIYQTHYVFSDLSDDEQAQMRKRIASRVPVSSVSNVATLVKRHDQWNINERQAKFTVNSLRLFDFFGIRWAIPLWDNEFTEFWHQVPLKHKKYKALYNKYVMEVCFAPLGIDFKRHENLTEKGTALFIKKVLPYSLAKRLRSFVHFVRTFNQEKHFNAFDEIYLLIYDGLTDDVKSRFNSIKNLNQVVAAHYLQLIKKSQ